MSNETIQYNEQKKGKWQANGQLQKLWILGIF